MWKLDYHLLPALPKLAWLAEIFDATRTVDIYHGACVERRKDWCVEGVWEGEFASGDFHRVENFFGSGVRIDGDRLIFSASVALIDRLFHVCYQDRTFVSNSLTQLLAATGAGLDPNHSYIDETFASGQGLGQYPRSFRVCHPRFAHINQEYHCNLTYIDGRLDHQLRSTPRSFRNFESYEQVLMEALSKIDANRRSSDRQFPVGAYATTSSGYDSTAVAVLAKSLGVTECFTTALDASLGERWQETGIPVAKALGFKSHITGRKKQKIGTIERDFLSSCIDGSEIFYHELVNHLLQHDQIAMLYTGYYGDVVWQCGRNARAFDDDIRRTDVSGLNVSEVRLRAGFFNLAVPMMYARNIADIDRISQSPEMEPWSLPQTYNRPIPRRIAESAKIPRDLFGMTKKAQLVYYFRPRNDELNKQFSAYLTNEVGIRRWQLKAVSTALHLEAFLAIGMRTLAKFLPSANKLIKIRRWIPGAQIDLRSLMFVWAVNSLAKDFSGQYRSARNGATSDTSKK